MVQKQNRLKWAYAGNTIQSSRVLNHLLKSDLIPSHIYIEKSVPQSTNSQFYELAKKYQIPLTSINDFNEYKDDLKELDFLFVFRFSLIPEKYHGIPKYGSINMHLSLLPKYKGVHPVSWAIIKGEEETGVTIHRINNNIDAGDIILQKSIPIHLEDDIFALTENLELLAEECATNFFKTFNNGELLQHSIKQLKEDSFYARRRFPEDGQIDWNSSSIQIYNLTRALKAPLPESFFYTKKREKVNIKSSKINFSIGEVIGKVDEYTYLIKTVDHIIEVTTDKQLKIGQILA